MSQVIKLQGGGTPEQTKLFKYPSGEIEVDRLVKAISLNLDNYINQQNWSNKRKQRFLTSVDKFISGIKNGNITEMSPVGVFEDTRGIQGGGVSDTTGNRRFRDDQEAGAFIKWVLNSQTPYRNPKEVEVQNQPAETFDINQLFATKLNQELFHTNSNQLDAQKLSDISSTFPQNKSWLNTVYNILEGIESKDWGPYSSADNYLQEVKNSRQRLRDKITANGSISLQEAAGELTRLGLNTDFIPYISGAALKQQQKSPKETKEQSQESTLQNILWSPETQGWWEQNKSKSITVLPSNNNRLEEALRLAKVNAGQYINNFLTSVGYLDYNQFNTNIPKNYTLPVLNNPQTNTWVRRNTSYNQNLGNILDYLITTKNTEYLTPLDNNQGYLLNPTVQLNNTNIVTVYNPNTRQLIQVPAYLLINDSKAGPYIKGKLPTMFTVPTIPWKKEGGILSMQEGGNMWNYINWDFTKRYRNALNNGVLSLIERKTNATDLIAPNNDHYDPEEGGKETESQSWYSDWVNQLTSNKDLAENWARGYLKHQTPYIAKYQEEWFPNGTFDFNTFKTSSLWKDQLNGIGHDVYKGKVYRIKGTNIYNTLDELQKQGYILPENANPIQLENNPLIDIYEVVKSQPETSLNNNQEKDSELVDPSRVQALSKQTQDVLSNQWQKWALPIAGSLIRYFNIQNTNRQLLDESLDGFRPYYKDRKHFERNIYGDYGALSAYSNNAANINNRANKWLTSDPSLTAFRQLEGERLASDERAKGSLINSNRIKETMEASIAQDKQNMEWGVDTANENRKNVWTNDLLESQARQGYISRRGQNRDTFLKELQAIAQQRSDLRTNLDMQALNAYINSKYTNNTELIALQNGLQTWVNNGKDIFEYPGYNRLVQLSKELNDQKLQDQLTYLGKIYGVGTNNKLVRSIVNNTAISVPQQFKSGGSISKEKIAKLKHKLDKQKLFLNKIQEAIKDNSRMLNSLANTMQKLLLKVK